MSTAAFSIVCARSSGVRPSSRSAASAILRALWVRGHNNDAPRTLQRPHAHTQTHAGMHTHGHTHVAASYGRLHPITYSASSAIRAACATRSAAFAASASSASSAASAAILRPVWGRGDNNDAPRQRTLQRPHVHTQTHTRMQARTQTHCGYGAHALGCPLSAEVVSRPDPSTNSFSEVQRRRMLSLPLRTPPSSTRLQAMEASPVST
eukprot:GHVU01192675.1.p1 GENE.GHVU01192675.1~~GHVU01192675.1.p1  ORF type:complete len:215 (-),score=13.54 GHVU01192675.1:1015-1638(-)